MRKILAQAFIFVFTSFNVFAGDGEYAVANIPSVLREHANIVKRKEEIRFELNNPGMAREYYKVVLTVLNENGNKYAMLLEGYDKLVSIESIDGNLYDAQGKKIKSLKKSDVEDHSGTQDINLADDNRIKYHNFYCKSYPYTVEYEVEFKNRNTMFFPSWQPQEALNYAVQESRLTVICPENYHLRYKAFNYPDDPQISNLKSNKAYTWELKDLKPIEWEYALPYWREISPVVFLGPSEFEVEGYKGNMQSWEDYGKFIYALRAGRDQLPPEVKDRVHQIADAEKDERRKISKLYEYMQDNTRYVSVQLGIGGWQPFDANYVASRKYGDCKALANYMYSLLKEAGIRSYYTLIHAGEYSKYFISDFPSSQFNHVIVCVPLGKDSIWLECTSQSLAAGYLSSFTADREALLIDENGGKLVHTPKYSFNENIRTCRINAIINEEGNMEADIHTRYKAIEQDKVESLINGYSKDKVQEYLKTYIELATYDVLQSEYKQEKSKLPSIEEWLKLTAPNYSQASGRRLFVNPNIIDRSNFRIEKEEDRKHEIRLYDEFTHVDSVSIRIPAGFAPESIPEDKTIESPFGKYERKLKVEGQTITYFRRFVQFSGKFPAQEYPKLVDFYEQIYKADQSQAVFVKSN